MTFLQKAREKASEVAREAAEATSKASGTAATKAQDPASQQMVRSGFDLARQTTGSVAREAAGATSKVAGNAMAKVQDPTTQARVKGGLASAGRGARTIVERIDPSILADVVIKATGLQEKANARLRQKGSIYRIGEILVSASLPPGITFTVTRIGDADEDSLEGRTSTEIMAEATAADAGLAGDDTAAGEILSLDGEQQASIGDGIDESDGPEEGLAADSAEAGVVAPATT